MESQRIKFRRFIASHPNVSNNKDRETGLAFKYDDLVFLFDSFDDDPYYFRISIPHVFEITDDNRNWIIKEMNELSIRFKVARLVILDRYVWALADGFVYSDENIDFLYKRTLQCLKSIYDELKNDFNTNFQKNNSETKDV